MIGWFFDDLAEAAHGLYWPIAPVLPENDWGRHVRLAALVTSGAVAFALARMLVRR